MIVWGKKCGLRSRIVEDGPSDCLLAPSQHSSLVRADWSTQPREGSNRVSENGASMVFEKLRSELEGSPAVKRGLSRQISEK